MDPPAKLAFTWSGLENPAEITLVTVEFLPRGKQSELVITHEGFTNPDVARRYEMGWDTSAGKFAGQLEVNWQEERVTHDERNKKVIREFTRIFKNEHNVDGINHCSRMNSLTIFVCRFLPVWKGSNRLGE